MAQQSLDFGTSAANDGEKLLTAFPKVDANFDDLYASGGTITHAVTDVASAATCDIGAAATDRVRITGTTTITSLGTGASLIRFVHFSGALILTHNATSLICIGAASITTVAGDTAIFSSDASGNWRMLTYNRAASLSTGDFSGPGSSTDNAILRFDGTGGKTGQNSIVSIDDSGNIAPVTNDTGALGTTALGWADLFLASGGTLHFANTDWVATHTSGILTVGTGDLRVTTAGTNTASAVTVGGTQTLTAKTLTSPVIGTSPTAAGATWTDLGIVTTADINGGTIDGTIIGGASAAAGTFTTIGGTAITGSGLLTVSLAGNAARFINSTDGASVQVARFEGDRATMADADEAYLSLMLSNDGGTQTEFARLTWVATDVNAGTSVDGRLDFAVATAGTLANELQLDGTALSPSTNDGLALGTIALGFADYHAATGHVWNVANGDAVITHSTGVFTVSTGDLRVTTAGTNAASAVTVGGTQTLTAKTLTSPVLTTPQINDTSADHQYVFAVSELAADRTVTLPLLAGNDVFVFADFIQTLTNKTIDLTSNTLTGSVAEFNTALESADFGTFAAAQTDNAAVRADGTAGLLQTSAFIISDTADLTAYDATNDGNPVFAFGASATERLTITPTYDAVAQTINYVLFQTDVASATADKGLFRFSPDATAVLDIDDGGINFAASKGISIAGTDILTDAAGTATLSNIDALDATTETTIEAAIDTLANLVSIQGLTVTLADATFDVIFGWDDSGSAYKNFALADLTTEGAPAAGDYLVIYGAEGDVRKANWSTLPGAGAGISNVVEDATPELGGDLESNNNDIKMEQFSLDAVAADIYFQKSRNAAIGSHTIVVDGDDLGKIIFQGSNGTTFDSAAQIRGEVDGTPGASTDMPGRLVFSTTADGSVTLTDRLILDATGALKPAITDTVSLGTSALNFSDLFLDSGAVINFDSGNATLTHSAGLLTSNVAVSLGTSNAFTCGTVELGAASDTTLARSAAGIVTVEGTPLMKAGKQTIWMPAGAMISATTNGPATGTVEQTTNKNMTKSLDFDATTSEIAQFMVAFPKSWDLGTVTFIPHWTAASGSGTFISALSAVAISNDDALDVAFGTAQSSTDTLITAYDNHVGPESAALTIAGTPAAADLVNFKLVRDISDTLGVDAKLIGIQVLFTTNAASDL